MPYERRHTHQSRADVVAKYGRRPWDGRSLLCWKRCCKWRRKWYNDYLDAKRAWPANASIGLRQHRVLLDVIAGGDY